MCNTIMHCNISIYLGFVDPREGEQLVSNIDEFHEKCKWGTFRFKITV
jgi:hypothetical protein